MGIHKELRKNGISYEFRDVIWRADCPMRLVEVHASWLRLTDINLSISFHIQHQTHPSEKPKTFSASYYQIDKIN